MTSFGHDRVYPSGMANVIDYVEFAVDDLEQAKAFYGKALGWTFNDYGPDYAGIKHPDNPGQEFGGLSPNIPASRGEGVLALVRTKNAADALASVLAAGGRVLGADHLGAPTAQLIDVAGRDPSGGFDHSLPSRSTVYSLGS